MSQVRVRWVQRVAGREIGDVEEVERTAFIEGCARNNRLVILSDIEAPPELLPPPPARTPAAPIPGSGSASTDKPKVLKLDPTPNEKPRK